MARYLIEVMYDGTVFHGSQLQGDLPTVQLALNNTLSTLFRLPIETYGASRTDEGVHALSNYYHFDIDVPIEFDLVYKCNAILPPGLAVKQYQKVADMFNARFDALSRRYHYKIYTRKNPFLLQRAYFYPFKLQQALLHQFAATIAEHQHFESFAKRHSQTKTFVCNIKASFWEIADGELCYTVEANRFLRGMVRGLVATQLHLARAGKSTEVLEQIIAAQDCTKAYFDAPGHGLYLASITYPQL